MPISATCPGCGKTISAPDSAAGHKAKCPHCSQVVTFPDDPAAALAAALRSADPAEALAAAAKPPEVDEGAAAPTPTPSRTGGVSRHSSTTTVSRMLARTSPYNTLRLLAAVIFGVGIAVSVLAFLGGLGALIVVSMQGIPWAGVGIFVGALVLAVMFFLGAKTVSELVRLWADVGDRARHVAQMFEESLNQPRDDSA